MQSLFLFQLLFITFVAASLKCKPVSGLGKITDEIKMIDRAVKGDQNAAIRRSDVKKQLSSLSDEELIKICLMTTEAIYLVKHQTSSRKLRASGFRSSVRSFIRSKIIRFIRWIFKRAMRKNRGGFGSLFTTLIGSIINEATEGKHEEKVNQITTCIGALFDSVIGIAVPYL